MIIFGVVASQQSGAFGEIPAPISAAWRILVHETANLVPESTVMINEVVWLNAAGGVIDVTSANHTANSSDGANTPDSCFDGIDTTYWAGFRDDGSLHGVDGWLQTEWPIAYEVRGIRLTAPWGNLENSPREFSVQYRTPGGAWLTLFKVVSQVDWDQQEQRSFQLGGRVWRLVVNSTNEGTKVAIGEIEFRSTLDVSERHHDDGGFPLVDSQVLPESRFNAFDNDPNTVWSSAALPARIEYWFQTTKPVNQVAVFSVADRLDQAPLTTQLFYSDDYGLSFTEAGVVPVITISTASGYGLNYGYFYGGTA